MNPIAFIPKTAPLLNTPVLTPRPKLQRFSEKFFDTCTTPFKHCCNASSAIPILLQHSVMHFIEDEHLLLTRSMQVASSP